jgi:hypothetical protein
MKFDLKYFILRTNALILYRESIKFTYKIKDVSSRVEMQNYIRYEYDINRKEENRKKIEYMLGNARKKLNEFKETFLMTN